MIEVKLLHKSAGEIIDIVSALRDNGLKQGTDFDFSFHRASYDFNSNQGVTPKHVIFKFYKEQEATMFALRWA